MEYKTIDQIMEYISELVSGKKPNGRIQLARIYSAYERECAEIEKEAKVEKEVAKCRKFYEVHKISDDMYIVEYKEDIFNDGKKNWFSPYYNGHLSNAFYETFDHALVALLCMKNKCSDAAPYIYRILNMTSED